MRTRSYVLSWITGMVLVADVQVARAWIRLQTQNGSCFAPIPVVQSVNLRIVYDPSLFPPPRPSGITAAEFRLELGSSPAIITAFTPNPAANVVLGDVNQGIHIEFSTCQSASPTVLLGTLQVFAGQLPPPQSWFVRGGKPGSGICPMVRSCAPGSAWIPVQGAEFSVNPTAPPSLCSAPFCETIAVEPSTWAAIKSVYR